MLIGLESICDEYSRMKKCAADGENYGNEGEETTNFIILKNRLELVEHSFLSLGLFCCSTFLSQFGLCYVRGRLWEKRLGCLLAAGVFCVHVNDEIGLGFVMFSVPVLRV